MSNVNKFSGLSFGLLALACLSLTCEKASAAEGDLFGAEKNAGPANQSEKALRGRKKVRLQADGLNRLNRGQSIRLNVFGDSIEILPKSKRKEGRERELILGKLASDSSSDAHFIMKGGKLESAVVHDHGSGHVFSVLPTNQSRINRESI
jgi:hypothetical protein